MRAVVYRGPNDLRVEELPVPQIGSRELLVKVEVCGVCPTDIKKIQLGLLPPPRVFGHETAGTIVEIGRELSGFAVGDRVALHHHVPCLRCRFCQHGSLAQCPQYKQTGITAGFEPAGGGYAEYVRVMEFVLPGVVRIPPGNSFTEGALLEPVNTVLKAVKRLNLLPEDRVAVVGQGPIGLMFTAILAGTGVEVTATDLIPGRLEKARAFGAAATHLNAGGEKDEAAGSGWPGQGAFDAVVVTAPVDAAVTQGLEWVRGAGKVLLFAHTSRGSAAAVDLWRICVEEKDLMGSYSSDFTLQEEVAEWVFTRRIAVEKLVTHRFGLGETAEAIKLASKPAEDTLKIVVETA